MKRNRLIIGTAVVAAAALIAAAVFAVNHVWRAPTTIFAYFANTIAIYPGDEVRVAGVKVGTIDAMVPQGEQTKMTLKVDHGIAIPADAKAVIVAPNLVAARYVQLTPAYADVGPTMADDAAIPAERTAVPVEWDQVKAQLMRLSTQLGPDSKTSTSSIGRVINSAADALAGNGDKLRQTIAQLSGVARVLAEGSGNIADIIANLQTFVTALRDSNAQIVQFQDHFATLTGVLNDSQSDLDGTLSSLSTALNDVHRFVAGSRNQTSEQVQRLANVTQILVDQKMALENLLHVTPNALANGYNLYNPMTGTAAGAFSIPNISNPLQFICGAIGAVENATAPETAKLCAQYLGPAARLFSINYLPVPVNPYLQPSPPPQDLIYTDPALAPGGAGSAPTPEQAPAVSAYTGAGDVAPPPGLGQPPVMAPGPNAPDVPGNAAYPLPALFPGAPVPTNGAAGLLLPAEVPATPPPPAQGSP
jgi:phospholipid/cholesterol/gamma-HCH transport system substrate-binding protein